MAKIPAAAAAKPPRGRLSPEPREPDLVELARRAGRGELLKLKRAAPQSRAVPQ